MDWNWMLSHISFSNVAMALFFLFIISSLVHRLTNKGPMTWPLMGIIPTVFLHVNDIYNWGTEVSIKYGGSFRYIGIWMSGVYGIMTVDPTNIEYMLNTNFQNFPKGRFYRERFYDLLGDGIFNADGKIWKEQRRAANSIMHSRQFVGFSFQRTSDLVHQKLLKLLDKFVDDGESIDLQDLLLRFTFDNICLTAYGVNPECLAVDLPSVAFAKAFEEANEVTLFRFLIHPFVWKTMKFFSVGSEKRLKKAVQIIHQFAEKTVMDRRTECCILQGLENKFDLLSRLMVAEDHFSNNFLQDFCISFVLAGRDTSSVGMTWFFWLIDKHPHVENQILDELYKIISTRKPKTERLDHIVFTVDEITKMEYLQAALSESLRLYPPVPVDFKEAQEEDVLPDGTVVKTGDKIIFSIYALARIEALWGKDCKEFKPERWMKDGRFEHSDQFKYVVFNAGPRLCLGKKFAYMQMKLLAASLLLRYSVKVVEGQTAVPKMTTTLYMKNGLLVTFIPRSHNRNRMHSV